MMAVNAKQIINRFISCVSINFNEISTFLIISISILILSFHLFPNVCFCLIFTLLWYNRIIWNQPYLKGPKSSDKIMPWWTFSNAQGWCVCVWAFLFAVVFIIAFRFRGFEMTSKLRHRPYLNISTVATLHNSNSINLKHEAFPVSVVKIMEKPNFPIIFKFSVVFQ